jgi:hypothetical protein
MIDIIAKDLVSQLTSGARFNQEVLSDAILNCFGRSKIPPTHTSNMHMVLTPELTKSHHALLDADFSKELLSDHARVSLPAHDDN